MTLKNSLLPLIISGILLSGCMDPANDVKDPKNPENPEDPGEVLSEVQLSSPDGFYIINSLSLEEGAQLLEEFESSNLSFDNPEDLEGYFLSSSGGALQYDPDDTNGLLVAQSYHPDRDLFFYGIIGYSEPGVESIPSSFSINATSNAILEMAVASDIQFSPEDNVTDEFQQISRGSLLARIGVNQLVLEGMSPSQAQDNWTSESIDRAFSSDDTNYGTYENYLYHYLDQVVYENANNTRSITFDFNKVIYEDTTSASTYQGTYGLAQEETNRIRIELESLGASITSLASDSNGPFITFASERYEPDRELK